MNNVKDPGLREETGRTRYGPSPAPPPARPGVLHPHGAGGARQREGVHRPTRQVAGRWASRGGIRTGARVRPTEGDNLKMEIQG